MLFSSPWLSSFDLVKTRQQWKVISILPSTRRRLVQILRRKCCPLETPNKVWNSILDTSSWGVGNMPWKMVWFPTEGQCCKKLGKTSAMTRLETHDGPLAVVVVGPEQQENFYGICVSREAGEYSLNSYWYCQKSTSIFIEFVSSLLQSEWQWRHD